MSEKYSTDELISVVENYTTGRVGVITYAECDAIIAKFRAADKLYEAANPIVEEISNFADNDLTEYLVIRFKDLVHLRKIIAEYEGKEK